MGLPTVGICLIGVAMSIYKQSKDYFLGHLPESEQLNFEEEYFSNPEALMALRAACDDLIDDYLRGKLAPQEQQKFEQRLNELPALREKVETDRALLFNQIGDGTGSVEKKRRSKVLFRVVYLAGFKIWRASHLTVLIAKAVVLYLIFG